MPNLATIIQSMREQGIPETVSRNNLAQFGDKARAYLGSTLFPERNVPQNSYREEQMRFRTVIAPDSSRYGSVQRRGADLYASFLVELANSNIGADITAADYEALVRMSERNLTMEATVRLTNWMDIRINRALIENNERMRWEFLINGRVTRTGDNGYREIVDYGVPKQQRIDFAQAAPAWAPSGGWVLASGTPDSVGASYNGIAVPATNATGWANAAVDPFDQLQFAAQILTDAGYTPGRMFTTRNVISVMSRNANVKARGGVAVVSDQMAGTNPRGRAIVQSSLRASRESINRMLEDDGLPPFETYDLMYRTNLGVRRFFPNGYVVIVANTERDVNLDFPDVGPLINQLDLFEGDRTQNIVGYTAVGTTTGETAPGRKMLMKHIDNLPPAIYAEGWQTSLIVPQEMQAFMVLKVL